MNINKLKRRILALSQRVDAMHIAPAFSCLHIIAYLYEWMMGPEDIFVLSKGHGCMAQYVVLEDLGILHTLDEYGKGKSLGAHPDRWTAGIHACTGSLGHGLPMAVGMALAERMKGSNARVFVLISDGELQEGSTWESVMVASNLKLTNLRILVDNNDWTGLARISETHPNVYPIDKKFEAFGWSRYSVYQTIKGDGVSYMQNSPIWHYRSPNPQEFKQAMDELA